MTSRFNPCIIPDSPFELFKHNDPCTCGPWTELVDRLASAHSVCVDMVKQVKKGELLRYPGIHPFDIMHLIQDALCAARSYAWKQRTA